MRDECRLSVAALFGAILTAAGTVWAEDVKPFTTQVVSTVQTADTTAAIDAARAVKAVQAAKAHRELGMASFYRVHGKTASGMKGQGNMTAAHRRLPFGSRVRVKDMKSGREVVVVITDRGPFKKSRVIDLSHAAAIALGITGRGVAKVEVLSE
jgi:rare lipoprotein A